MLELITLEREVMSLQARYDGFVNKRPEHWPQWSATTVDEDIECELNLAT